MRPFIYSVQYLSASGNFETKIDRGIRFGNSYADVTKTIEDQKKKDGDSIIDLYIVAMEQTAIALSEESYDKLINGETL